MLSQDWDEFRAELKRALRDAVSLDLRWSYLILVALAVAGAVANWILPHGWTAWPVVLAAGLLVVVNEAADRNGEGIPPLTVYAFFGGAVALWLGGMMLVSLFNPVVLLLGVGLLGYQCGRGYMRTRERRELMNRRRMAGECVHCGEPVVDGETYCNSCGELANPDGVRISASTVRTKRDVARVRAAIKPVSDQAVAASKEQALLAKRHRRSAPAKR